MGWAKRRQAGVNIEWIALMNCCSILILISGSIIKDAMTSLAGKRKLAFHSRLFFFYHFRFVLVRAQLQCPCSEFSM